VIAGITDGSLPEDEKEELLGQAYFFRAWAYFRLWRIYGGIPILKEALNPIGDDNLAVPRATSKEVLDFMCEDLDKAIEYLPSQWPMAGSDYGRVTKGAAMALKGRMLLWYASPLYNRANQADRWQAAYQANKEAMEETWYEMDPGTNASGWAAAFATYSNNPEAIFFTLYNTISSSNSDGGKNNNWEQNIRPKNLKVASGSNAGPTSEIVDLFPMADGKRPSTLPYAKLGASLYSYNPVAFFVNRDPRFYRSFAFPGVRWAASGVNLASQHNEQPELYPYENGDNYELWSYCWHAEREETVATGFYADGLNDGERKSLYVRKRSNDTDLSNPLYLWDATNGFKISAAPYLEIRFGEVLLNFAEAACGAGHLSEAVSALQEIRRRVGYTPDNNYGLDSDLASDQAKLFAAILYERQVELAYEGRRFDDMRRWLLWDGGASLPEGAPSTWQPSGWGGNTCTYLGVPSFNGTRRHRIQVTAIENAAENYASDPLKDDRPSALNLMTADISPLQAGEEANRPIDLLSNFYTTYTHREELTTDGDEEYYVLFRPEYYFIGFRSSAMSNNAANMHQTIGWVDYHTGTNGVYDPIAE